MVDSAIVLWGQTLAYTFYVLAILVMMVWFTRAITKDGTSKNVRPVVFYSFALFLVALGVSLHIITHETIPWKPMDLNRADIVPDRTYDIRVRQHTFIFPEQPMRFAVNEKVLFRVVSDDLTYGFGVFRADNSMVFQMQVIPGHVNDILWQFTRPGTYTIRSTEYSGPKGTGMIVPDALTVVE